MPVGLQQQPAWLVWISGAAAALVLTWMAYAWVVVPSHERTRQADEINAAAAAERGNVRQFETRLNALKQVVNDRRAALDVMPIKLGNRRDLNRQIAALIELAQAQGLEVLQLQPGDSIPGEHYDLTGLRLEAVADFPSHLAYLDTLHASFPDISVIGMELQSSPREANPRPRATLNLVWFTAVEGGTITQASTNDR